MRRRRQHGQRDERVVAASVGGEREEDAGQDGVAHASCAREPVQEQHQQGQPLRAQRAEVGDLVRADGREREGGARQQRRALAAAQVARQPVRGQGREREGQQPRQVEEEDAVAGEGHQRQHEHGGAQHRLVQAQRVREGMEDVAVRQPRGRRAQRVRLPPHLPGEEGAVARVDHREQGRQRPGQGHRHAAVQEQGPQRAHELRRVAGLQCGPGGSRRAGGVAGSGRQRLENDNSAAKEAFP